MADSQFIIRGREFVRTHPDFNERLDVANTKRLDMDPAARDEIERLAMPEIPYWLTDETRSDDADNLNNLIGRPDESRAYVRELAAKIERQGYGREPSTGNYSDTDKYIQQREQDRRERRRR